MSAEIKEENFKQIYTETYNNVLKFVIVKCNDITEVNDIIQDTYLELLKILKRRKVLNLENVNNYIIGISNNIIKRHYSKVVKFSLSNDEDENLNNIKDEFDLEEDFITRENVKDIWEYIKDKDLQVAKIFYLYFSLDLKIKEIAESLDLNESNVKNKIYRTIIELKKVFKKGCDNNG